MTHFNIHKRKSHSCIYYACKPHSINQRTADSAFNRYDKYNIVDALKMK